MRAYISPNEIRVVLSERNLLAGLHKLQMEGSARTLTSYDVVGEDGVLLRLEFETNDEHYNHPDRHTKGVSGMMHHETETFIRDHS